MFDFTCLNKYFQKNKSPFSHSISFKPPLTNYFLYWFLLPIPLLKHRTKSTNLHLTETKSSILNIKTINFNKRIIHLVIIRDNYVLCPYQVLLVIKQNYANERKKSFYKVSFFLIVYRKQFYIDTTLRRRYMFITFCYR